MRKVLSFVLVLALVLSSFSMAFAADKATAGLTDISGNANQDAIQVAYDLGIVTGNPDGTFLPGKDVTRAEFAAMLTRALDIPSSALAGYTATSFKDTAGYAWAVPYLAFCQSKGILLGDGAGNVFPGKTITVNEAMTMALRAIGYTANSSLLVGVWPSNYVSIAQNNDLYDDVAAKTTVDKASAAQIIYNLLTVQKVSVNTDGSTDYLWKGKVSDNKPAYLLNTNLGCTAYEKQILGASGYGYDDSIINITSDLGAYGDAYLNSDDEVVAFTKSSTALTGKLSDNQKKFEVGDVEYDISNADNTFTTDGAYFINGDYTKHGKILIADIAAFASANSDDNKTVTLNVDLSGKTIKDIYSAVAWKADDNDKAAADVQDDIADKSLLSGNEFATTDDDTIDYNSFELVGVASLDKIAENDVVYVYNSEADDVIRKVAVGTETVEGTVDEVDYDNATVTVGAKEYDVAPSTDGAIDVNDIDFDSEGTFYLDYQGEIYDFDGTNKVDTYGIVKLYQVPGVDNAKLKLYTSEDATKTYTFSDEPKDIDWTTSGSATVGALTVGNLVGYSLNADGDLDAIDNTAANIVTGSAYIKSTKVIRTTTGGIGTDRKINSDAVVLTYDGGIATPYDVAKPADLEAGACAGQVDYILDGDGNIAALYVEKADATTVDDAIYGVINTRVTAKNDDGDKVYKYTGFIDGTAFTYKTDTDMAAMAPGGFGVYGFVLDSSDQITDPIINLATVPYSVATPDTNGLLAANVIIDAISSDKTIITDAAGNKYTIADDAVVYKYSVDDEEFTVGKLSALKKAYTVSMFVTNGSDSDNSDANIVVYYED